AAADLEQMLLSEPGLRGYIDVNGLKDLQITVLFREGDAEGYAALARNIGRAWKELRAPPLDGAEMRVAGESLLQVKVGASLVPTTVLGTTENDQIHFFHHLHERDDAPLDQALLHALRVSGRAIVFATLINAAGFLALSLSTFPPLRQFGLVTSAAFMLALIADFTALPAGLWMVDRRSRQKVELPRPLA